MQSDNIEQRDFTLCLECQMQSQITFVHRGDRVMAHAGMPVYPVDPTARSGRKQIAEQHKALQVRSTDHDGNIGVAKYFLTYFERASDVAELRRTVECGTDFVLECRSAIRLEGGEDRGQL